MVNNYAFVDAQNVNLSVQNQGRKLDWNKFRVYLSEQYHVTQAYLFIGFMEEQKELYEFLQQAGFTLIYKAVHTTKEGMTKGNVDAELVLQAMIDLPNYDQAIIVTGDGDFACLVKYLLEQKKLLKLIVPNIRQHSGLLRDVAADYITSLSALKVKLRFRPGQKRVVKVEKPKVETKKIEPPKPIPSKTVPQIQKKILSKPIVTPPTSKPSQLKPITSYAKKPNLAAVAQKAKQLLIQHEHDVPTLVPAQIIPKAPRPQAAKPSASPNKKKFYRPRFAKKGNQERERPSFLE